MSYPIFVIHGTPGETQTFNSSNTARDLETIGFDITRGSKYATGALLSVEINPIRLGFDGAVPTQGGLGHLLQVGDSLRLTTKHEVTSIQIISENLDSHAKLQLTPLYGKK